VAELKSDYFAVALIGHTLLGSNLTALRAGDMVNVEYDVLGKYIVNARNL